MLLAVEEKYPSKEDLMPKIKKWTTVEKDIYYLRELPVVEVLHDPMFIPDNPHQDHDPERVTCAPSMWQKFTRTVPEKYTGIPGMYERG